MIAFENVRLQLEAESGVPLLTATLVTMLYKWSKRYNTRDMNMCERKRLAGYPFLYNDEASAFKAFALNQLHKRHVHYERQVPKFITLYCRKPRKSTKQ